MKVADYASANPPYELIDPTSFLVSATKRFRSPGQDRKPVLRSLVWLLHSWISSRPSITIRDFHLATDPWQELPVHPSRSRSLSLLARRQDRSLRLAECRSL